MEPKRKESRVREHEQDQKVEQVGAWAGYMPAVRGPYWCFPALPVVGHLLDPL